jgi:predicted ester cyclase
MQAQKNKAVVRRFIEEFKNKASPTVVDELLAVDFVHHFKDPRLPAGREALKILGGMVTSAFPGVHATVEDLLADGDKVVERTTATGVHKGEFNGVPPTDRPVTWTEMHIYRLENGKIAELWSEIDFLAILMQIGAMPGP